VRPEKRPRRPQVRATYQTSVDGAKSMFGGGRPAAGPVPESPWKGWPRRVQADVPPALDAVCRKALALEPAQRYGTALDLAVDVERWLADEPVAAPSARATSASSGRWPGCGGRSARPQCGQPSKNAQQAGHERGVQPVVGPVALAAGRDHPGTGDSTSGQARGVSPSRATWQTNRDR
jgi:hypothetical protein